MILRLALGNLRTGVRCSAPDSLGSIAVGDARGDCREILSGLTAGERIVVAPPPLLADGGRVAIQEATR